MAQHTKSKLVFAALVLAFATFFSFAPAATARPSCPTDGNRWNTSGTTAIGATCNDALSHISSQEWPKMIEGCPYGIYDYTFVHNGCVLQSDSTYRASGWFSYRCQTDCYGTSEN